MSTKLNALIDKRILMQLGPENYLSGLQGMLAKSPMSYIG